MPETVTEMNHLSSQLKGENELTTNEDTFWHTGNR